VVEAAIELDPDKRVKLEAFREEVKRASEGSTVHRVYKEFNSLHDFEVVAIQDQRQVRSLLIAAGLTAAAANVRAALSAALGKRCGWITDALLGHLTMTTAGVSCASTSSTAIASVAVIWPLASSVTLVTGSRSIRDLQPRQFSSTDMC
jgi:hypothetical protein